MAPRAATGPAHVAVVSFLAARAAPTGGFWIALAGGVALARVAERLGARLGFGASAAAMLETVAIIGPARLGVPLTQAVSAPILGRLHARNVGFWPQLLACATVRLLHNAATTAFFIWVITGGLDAYAGTYDALGRRIGIDVGTADALALTLLGLLAWAAFASTVQVLVYRRGLRTWAESEPQHREEVPPRRSEQDAASSATNPSHLGRFDPRAVAGAALIAFVLLLSSTAWVTLAAVAGWLALAWLLSRAEPDPVPAGLLFAAILAATAFFFALGGGLGLDTALGARLEPRCWCWWPPGCARPPGRSGCARCRAACSVACAGSHPRPRPPRCSTRLPPRVVWRPPAARSPRDSRGPRSGRPRSSTPCWPG